MPGVRDPYTLVFTVEEVELLLQGLGKLPAERSYNLLTRLGQELAQENQRRQAPAVAGVGNGTGLAGGLATGAAEQAEQLATPPPQ